MMYYNYHDTHTYIYVHIWAKKKRKALLLMRKEKMEERGYFRGKGMRILNMKFRKTAKEQV